MCNLLSFYSVATCRALEVGVYYSKTNRSGINPDQVIVVFALVWSSSIRYQAWDQVCTQLEMEFCTYSFIVCLQSSNPQTTPFLFSMCFLRDLPQQKNLRGDMLGELPNFLCSQVPMEIFLFHKIGKKWGNQKRVVYTRAGSCTCAFSWGLGTPLHLAPTLGCPSLRRMHL